MWFIRGAVCCGAAAINLLYHNSGFFLCDLCALVVNVFWMVPIREKLKQLEPRRAQRYTEERHRVVRRLLKPLCFSPVKLCALCGQCFCRFQSGKWCVGKIAHTF